MIARRLHRAMTAICYRRIVGNVRRWKSFVFLYLFVFLVVLPLMCHDMPGSIYFHETESQEEVQRRIQHANDARLDWSKKYLAVLNDTRDIPEARVASGNDSRVDIAITVVTVSRNRQIIDSYKPQYLSQVIAKLLAYWHDAKVQGFRYNISISVCNVDVDPDSYVEVQRLAGVIDIFNRFNKRYISLMIHREKEKQDYVFCLNRTLNVYDPRYVFVIEDDALPTADMFPTLQHVVYRHLDRKFVHGRLVVNTDDVTYVKFFHPKWLLNYYSVEPERIPGLLAFGSVFGTLLQFVYCYFKPDSSDVYMTWFLFTAFVILVAIAVGRSNLVWLRSLLGPEFYSYVPAPSCCTPAMLFPRQSATQVINYLSRVRCSQYMGKDSILEQFLRTSGKKKYLVEPNTFTHIGFYSALHSNLVNPRKLE